MPLTNANQLRHAEGITLYQAAMGRKAELGDFYNAHTDSFVHGNLFARKKLTANFVLVDPKHEVTSDYSFSDSFSERVDKLKINAEAKLSLLAGLIEVKGAVEYTKDKRTSSRQVACDFNLRTRTMNESVNLYQTGFDDFVDLDSIGKEATHVVVGIERGAEAVVSLKYNATGGEEPTSVKASISAKADLEKKLFKKKKQKEEEEKKKEEEEEEEKKKEEEEEEKKKEEEEEEKKKEEEEEEEKKKKKEDKKNEVEDEESEEEKKEPGPIPLKNEHMEFKVHADIASMGESIPTSIEEALALINTVPDLMKKNERGVPLRFVLLDVRDVAAIFDTERTVERMMKEIELAEVQALLQIKDEMETQATRIGDLRKKVNDFAFGLDDEVVDKVQTRFLECNAAEQDFQDTLSALIPDIRAGKAPVSDLLKAKKIFRDSPLTGERMDTFMAANASTLQIVDFMQELQMYNVEFVQSQAQYFQWKRQNRSKPLFVLFFASKNQLLPAEWRRLQRFFFNLLKEAKKQREAKQEPTNLFAVVNINKLPELQQNEKVPQGIRVVKLLDNKYVDLNCGLEQPTKNALAVELGRRYLSKSTNTSQFSLWPSAFKPRISTVQAEKASSDEKVDPVRANFALPDYTPIFKGLELGQSLRAVKMNLNDAFDAHSISSMNHCIEQLTHLHGCAVLFDGKPNNDLKYAICELMCYLPKAVRHQIFLLFEKKELKEFLEEVCKEYNLNYLDQVIDSQDYVENDDAKQKLITRLMNLSPVPNSHFTSIYRSRTLLTALEENADEWKLDKSKTGDRALLQRARLELTQHLRDYAIATTNPYMEEWCKQFSDTSNLNAEEDAMTRFCLQEHRRRHQLVDRALQKNAAPEIERVTANSVNWLWEELQHVEEQFFHKLFQPFQRF